MKEKRTFNELYSRTLKTQGVEKLWNYYLDLTKRKDFNDEVEEVRKACVSLDKSGKRKVDYFNLSYRSIYLCIAWGLDGFAWEESIRDYILEEKLTKPEAVDLCRILSLDILDDEFNPEESIIPSESDLIKALKPINLLQNYPIVMLISPFASLRDIQDFVEKNYALTINLLKKIGVDTTSKVFIGKSKKKKKGIQDRNELIYKNRHLPRKEIMRLVADKLGYNAVIDYGYIGKIISTEKKRRKEL